MRILRGEQEVDENNLRLGDDFDDDGGGVWVYLWQAAVAARCPVAGRAASNKRTLKKPKALKTLTLIKPKP